MTQEKDNRTTLLIGEKGIENLKKSTVLVAGCGAVGGFALEALARAGVGHLIVIDFDTFDVTNLNRQLFATTKTLGELKTKSVEERLKSINPEIIITQKPIKISAKTMEPVSSIICVSTGTLMIKSSPPAPVQLRPAPFLPRSALKCC